MSEKVYMGASISDIHFGAKDPAKLYNELKSSFLNYIKELPVLDFVMITGDYYDKRISMDSEAAKYSILFLSELLELSKEKGFVVRMLQGTKSHDNDQLRILEMLMAKNGDYNFNVIYTLSEETLFDNFRVLYIPEEYMTDAEDYYADAFHKDQRYDMIFMHGLVTDAAFVAEGQESEIVSNKAPIFETSKLISMSLGAVISGHIHTPMIIKDKFYYTGSFSRWSHGEEADKGFNIISYSPVRGQCNVEFIKNIYAPEYVTLRIANEEFFNCPIENIINKLTTMVHDTTSEFIRFKIYIPESYEKPNLLINAVKEVFNANKRVKTIFEVTSKANKERAIKEKIDILMKKYQFIFDKKISYEKKISLFVKEKYGTDIDEDEVRDYIYGAIK